MKVVLKQLFCGINCVLGGVTGLAGVKTECVESALKRDDKEF